MNCPAVSLRKEMGQPLAAADVFGGELARTGKEINRLNRDNTGWMALDAAVLPNTPHTGCSALQNLDSHEAVLVKNVPRHGAWAGSS